MDEEGIRGRPREESGIDLPASKPYCYRPGNIYQDPCRWSVFLGRGKEEAVHRSEVIRSAFYQFRGKSNKKESKSNEHVPISHALIPILVPPNADPSTVHYENWEIELERSDKTLWEIVRARERFACFSSFFFLRSLFSTAKLCESKTWRNFVLRNQAESANQCAKTVCGWESRKDKDRSRREAKGRHKCSFPPRRTRAKVDERRRDARTPPSTFSATAICVRLFIPAGEKSMQICRETVRKRFFDRVKVILRVARVIYADGNTQVRVIIPRSWW